MKKMSSYEFTLQQNCNFADVIYAIVGHVEIELKYQKYTPFTHMFVTLNSKTT